ncbi:hypothetical protein EJ05DRAFT_474210 [Pseudovirgaria hyperparasitica]|uniref:GRF-like zinc ribbon domain-containing protein n=1 Tax=Pseudovirgaria hyperparasitica TaxID=470096 RepID=A0A6A6WBU1_9PEZI|nr:uncharacterized protein EJ05DRAFT_474210 [Pseudovirgaria hyperparasitica]KAF2760318.1 hypothetical protein EJ05DRAFT_474210 [Pseudovirgaria hyperparasitica]
MPAGLKNPFSRKSTPSEPSKDVDVDIISSCLTGLSVQKEKHLDDDLLESNLLRQDPHLWAAKAVLMNLLLQTMQQQRLSPVTVNPESILNQLVVAYQGNGSGQSGTKVAFVNSALYKAFPSPRDVDDDLTAQLAAMLTDICGTESRDQIPELHAVSSQNLDVFSTQSTNQSSKSSFYQPSQSVKVAASSKMPPSTPEMNVVWAHEAYRTTDGSVFSAGSVSAFSGYNTPSRGPPPSAQSNAAELRTMSTPSSQPLVNSFPSNQSSPSPSYPSPGVKDSPSPVTYPGLHNSSTSASRSPPATGSINSGSPLCLWCERKTIRRPTQSNANGNAGRFHFKCSNPDCMKWMGWSERDAGQDQGNICRCGHQARGQIAPHDSVNAGTFRYICKKGPSPRGCGFESYP